MPNIVQSAVGTQRQFTKQPVATYEKRLRQTNASNGIAYSGAGERLYRALNGLGDSLMQYAIHEEDRARSNTVRVDKLINAATESDWKTLDAIELLNKYGEFQLRDNPYAVAAIEQARGKYMSEKFNQQYSLLQAQQPVLTAQEEADRYTQEKNKFLDDNKGASFNVEQFYKGFWSSNPNDLGNLANQKIAEQSKSLMSIRDKSIEADFSTFVLENYDKSPEDFYNGLQSTINKSILMSYPPERRVEALKAVLQDVAAETGDPSLIKKLGELIVTNTDNGEEPMTLGSLTSLTPYIRMAEQTALAQPSEKVLGYQEAMIKSKNKEALDTWYAGLSKEDQHLMRKDYAQVRKGLIAKDIAAQERMVANHSQQIQSNLSQQNTHISFLRAMQGYNDNTVRGVKATDAYNEVAAYFNSDEFQKIRGTEEGTLMFAKALMWAPNTEMQKEYKAGFLSALVSATPSEMADKNNFKSITNARSLWYNNPGRFQAIFGADLTKEMQHLQALIDFTEDEVEGYKLFCGGRETRGKEPQMYAEYQDAAKTLVSSNETFSLYDADTDNSYVEMSYSDAAIREGVTAAVTDLQASGVDAIGALHTVGAKLKDNYVAYKGNILPKVMFAQMEYNRDDFVIKNGINVHDANATYGAATAYMNRKIELAKGAYPGTDWNWKWHNGKVLFYDMNSNMREDPKDLETFFDEVNNWHATRDQEPTEEATKESDAPEVKSVGNRRAVVDDWHWDGR